ncbi:UDP-glucose 4-epimerase [Sinosporangium album]|uniref:UDP-glucose 4-epimerase n=1 Tax=Sinosporangium album TaxID=504805 RepID=A0A1G8GHJ5_9ACTN|nr:NAD(P)-dependent oxidoreductase [Sinosporangium album]SDH93832.1 UDP-glucose 4-epimerase [Sinosporangium album]
MGADRAADRAAGTAADRAAGTAADRAAGRGTGAARVVVTGGSGFVGRHLARALAERGDEVTVFDISPPHPSGIADGVRYVTGDVRDIDALSTVIDGGIDVVYHLAAVVGVDLYLARPLDVVDINLIGTRHVLELAERASAKVIFTSTSEVFGKNPGVPWSEDADRLLGSTATDRWSYATSKALAEHLIFAFARQRGLRASIIRYFNLYGPGQRPAFLVSRSIHRALRGVPPVVYDDGGQTRSFTYIDDAVSATLAIADAAAAEGESFNVGCSDEMSIGHAVKLIVELTGCALEVVPVDTRRRFGDTYQDLSRRIPDTTKVRTLLGWQSTVPLHDGLAATIEWARANPWWLEQPDTAFA